MIVNTQLYHTEPYLIVVDDDPDDLELIVDTYAELKQQHRVKTLNSGEELLDFLDAIPDTSALPSLIVLDYNMPRLNGITILVLLRKDNRYRHIPVAVYSTTLSEEKERDLLISGATYCHQKPTTQHGVQELMIEFLSIADAFNKNKNIIN